MEISRYWRTTHERMRLVGSNCQNCKIKHFPPRDVCPDCGFSNSDRKTSVTIYTSTEAPATIPVDSMDTPKP